MKELTLEEKQKIVDEVNNTEINDEVEGDHKVSIFTMANMEELQPFLKELTPMDMFDKSVALNQTTLANLADLLPKLSKKNIIKLFFATLKLPEKDAHLKFGGKKEDQHLCEMAYANSQMARNALVHVLGTTAIAQAKYMKKKELESKNEEPAAEVKAEENKEKGQE